MTPEKNINYYQSEINEIFNFEDRSVGIFKTYELDHPKDPELVQDWLGEEWTLIECHPTRFVFRDNNNQVTAELVSNEWDAAWQVTDIRPKS
jgi:hypothetical protein